MQRVKVKGECIITNQDGKLEIKNYERTLPVPNELKSNGEIAGYIKKGPLKSSLKVSWDTVKRIRTIEVVKVEKNIKDDNAKQSEVLQLLSECIKKGCVPDNYDSYKTDEAKILILRKALGLYRQV